MTNSSPDCSAQPAGSRILLAGVDVAQMRQKAAELERLGQHVVCVSSVVEALESPGKFDRALFEYELRDGSGIVLAANMMLRGKIRSFDFMLPRRLRDELGRSPVAAPSCDAA
jgi:hypothetical protein